MREAHPSIAALGAGVVAVGTGARYQAALLEAGTPEHPPMPFPCVVDAAAALYTALGIERVPWHVWLRPGVWRNYVDGFRRGGRQGRVTGDPRRLSGVAIVEPDRTVAWLHRSRTVGDYPPISTVLGALGSPPAGDREP